MSVTLFKATLKKNWLLLLIFFVVLCLYSAIMISMYDPSSLQSFGDMLKLLPSGIIDAFGFGNIAPDLAGFIANTLYGMIMFAFPMIYCIILAGRLIAKPVDDGSMAYFLSTPNSRSKVAITQGIYALASIAVMFAFVFCVGVAVSAALFPNELDVLQYLNINLITMLVSMTTIMICFFFSCLFNDIKKALGFGCGVSIAFLLMNMLGNASEDLEILNEFSIYGWYDPATVAHEGLPAGATIAYISLIVLFFVAGVLLFRKKRLPL